MNIDRDNIPEHDDFYSFGLHPTVLDGLDAMGFNHPSPVQEASIPHILEGQDVISCAQTGTGKTAAFVLPILSELASRRILSGIVAENITVCTSLGSNL